ncbi:MAG TPA: transporter [Polyangiaceae bacterium]|nr:transporter [Polyangiaceae bacterium]
MHRSALRTLNLGLFAAVFCGGASALSQPATPAAAELPPAEPAAAKPKPPPYSLPWQLRPVVAGNVVRSDTALAFYKHPTNGNRGTTVASTLLFSYKVIENFAPLVRVGLVSNSPPDNPMAMPSPKSATGFLNPVVGATYALKFGPTWKLGLFLGLTVPVGSGGGDDAKPEAKAANAAGIAARSAMDNAMFAVNDFVVFPGVGFAYTNAGLTAQVEATLVQLTQVRGGTGMGKAQLDDSRTNFTTGLHLGYFIIPMLSVGGDLRHQRWLSTPKAVEADEALPDDAQLGLRDTTTFAIGPRFHFKLSESVWFRPGVAFAMPLDDPMKKSKYKIVQLDLPVAF